MIAMLRAPSFCLRAAALMLALALLAGCGSSGGRSITLYNGQHEQTTDSLVEGFEKATGITVNVRNDDEDTLADEIVTEGSHSPADVIYTENSPALEYLQGKGLLAPVDPSTLASTPSKYDSPQGDWVGVSARVSVLIYNPGLIAQGQLPSTVLELAEPRYKGKLAFAAGETDFQPIVTSVVRAYGEAAALRWLKGIEANAGSHIYPDNETIADEVNRGAVAFGVVNQYYWYRMRAELGASNVHSRIAYFAPRDPGYVIDVSGAGVLKSSSTRPRPRSSSPSSSASRARRSSPTRSASSTRSTPASPRRRPRPPSTAAAEPDHDPRARRRLDGDRAAAQGRAALRRSAVRGWSRSVQPWPSSWSWHRPRVRRAASELPLGSCYRGPRTIVGLIFRPLTATLLWNTVRLTVVVTAAVRGHRHRRGLVHRAHRPAGPARVGGARRRAARDPRLRRELRLGLAQHLGPGLPRRGARDDAGGLPARVPARRRQLPRRRSRSGGGRAQPRRRAPRDVLADHARPGPRGDPRRLPARRARDPRRVRRVRDPRLPDLHDRDLHRVQRLVQRAHGLRALARARARQPGRPVGERLARGRGRVSSGPARPARRPSAAARTRDSSQCSRASWRSSALALGVPVGASVYWMFEGGHALLDGRLAPGRGLAHRSLQRARRRARDSWRCRWRCSRPSPGRVYAAARAHHLPRARDARPRDRARALLLHRALRRRVPLPERTAAGARLRDPVLPARARRRAAPRSRRRRSASRRSPARSGSGGWRCCGA